MIMAYLDIIVSVLTVIAGGGWFVTYKAYKRKNMGEAVQSEANGWITQQEAYRRTIDDLKSTCEYIAKDRDLLRKENEELRNENKELRERMNEMEQQILDLRKEVARQGRRIADLSERKKNKETTNN